MARANRTLRWLPSLVTATVLLAVGLLALSRPVPVTAQPPTAPTQVGLYETFELQVQNGKTYSNPFDFNVIELRATFTAPSGRQIAFFGFYDGDGQGGQTGNVWKLRFMPDETGTWTYTYTWSDGTPGGSGSFDVVNRGAAGLLRPHPANPAIWQRVGQGDEIPYYVAVEPPYNTAADPRLPLFLDYVKNDLGARGVAFVLLNRVWQDCAGNSACSPSQPVFSLANWHLIDAYLAELQARGLGLNMMFYSDDSERPKFSGQSSLERLLLKYTVARMGAFAGLSFDSGIDILEYRSASWNDWFAQELLALDPWDHPVGSRHGGGSGNFTCSTCTYDARGDVHPTYNDILSVMQTTTKPVFYTDRWREDYRRGNFNADSLRKAMWHSAMAGGAGFLVGGQNGSLRLSDYATDLDAPVQHKAFSDFWHQRVDAWSAFSVCNSLVTNGLCLGQAGQEYVLYIEDGNPTTLDLSGVTGTFGATWLNPRTGTTTTASAVTGGAPVTLAPPVADGGDWALHLVRSSGVPAPGDLNGDGGVDIVDVQLCVNVFLGTETDPVVTSRADVNSDATVDVLDVQAIVNLILGA